MDYHIKWHKPIKLIDGDKSNHLIYTCDEKEIKTIPEAPGVYAFACRFGSSKKFTPLYVGQAQNLRTRINQHFQGNVPLMNKIKGRRSSERYFICGELVLGRGQGRPKNLKKYLNYIEKKLISQAFERNSKLFNKNGVTIKTNRILSRGRVPSFIDSKITDSE